ncbi:MAG TPA: PTS sorbose transporter subunit IIC [Ktedonobacter sp.]|jgi:mannose/fructose/N-acetylgalactosamine-specific phosphotransferase system component IIC|nr:PTS sorbose transporter subunit IIC [Ktedonobacter sp.]
MHSYSIWIALVLAIWAYIGIVTALGPGLWWQEALISGFITGVIVGNIPLGLTVGASLTLLSLGLWTYGGATIPDFQTGAIVGTAVGALGGGFAAGFAIALPTALLMTQLDVLGRAVTTVFIHGADHYVEDGNERGVSTMHLLGQLPWGLTRAIPVFLAIWLGAGPLQSLIQTAPQWFINGMTTVGHVLPALGFALLLSMLPLRRYWPFLLVGFVLFAYLSVPIIGIAILAVAIGFLVNMMQTRSAVNV